MPMLAGDGTPLAGSKKLEVWEPRPPNFELDCLRREWR